jgi:UDP-glucose:(heptosyl)LPS alpha-1,3-glucosyltransferase
MRRRLGAEADETVFLTLAKNYALKGVRETIRAFAERLRSGLPSGGRLAVVGGERAGPYKRLAERLGVSDRVHFAPPTDEAFRWYAAADVCVLLSWYDPCSRVVLEALRWGLPSITTRYNGAAEALADGAGIVIFRPSDTQAASEAMGQLADPRHRAAAAEACLAKSAHVSMDRHVEQLLAVYREVATRHD